MIPRKLVLKNFLSHSHSSIDFDKFNVALILGKFNNNTDESNGSGKSSILNAIEWNLFDKSRHKRKDKVVKRDATVCSVSFEFQIEQDIYRVVRKRNKVVSESDVLLYQWNGSDWVNISCDTNRATDAKIEKVINFNHEIFINSVYFKQGDVSLFTDSTASKRKDIIKSLLKLDIWDEYQKKAKNYAREYAVKIEEKKLLLADINEIDGQIEKLNSNIKRLKKQIKKQNSLYQRSSNKLIAKKSSYKSILDFNVKEEIKEINGQITKEKAQLNTLNSTATQNKKSIQKYEKLLNEQNRSKNELKKKIDSLELLDLKKAQSGLIQGRTKERILKQQISDLQKNINLEKCETCFRKISTSTAKKIEKRRASELKKAKQQYESISQKLKAAEKKFRNLEKAHRSKSDMILKLNKVLVKVSSLEKTLGSLKTKQHDIENQIEQIDLEALQKQINDIKSKYSKSNIEDICAELEDLEDRVSKLRKNIDQLNIEFGSCVSERNRLSEKKKSQDIIQNELYDLNDKYLLYDKLKNYFGKDGIQATIIENVVGELENYSNQILSKICNEPTSVIIKCQRQTEKGTWSETFDIGVNVGGASDDLESLSGGEKFRVALALRLALSKILSKRSNSTIKFLMLDEVSSSLDAKGLEIFGDIILKLGNEMKILIISHDDRLKSKFSDIIMVSKDANGSKVMV